MAFYEFRNKCLATDSLHRDNVNSKKNTQPKEEILLQTIKVECTEQEYDDCFAEPLQNDKNIKRYVKEGGLKKVNISRLCN